MHPLSDKLSQIPVAPGVYVLCGRNGRYYTGAARNLRDRLSAHLSGKATRTKNQRPLFVVHIEQQPTFAEALKREQFLKSGAGRVWLKEQQTVSP
jgi:putative endonuclease